MAVKKNIKTLFAENIKMATQIPESVVEIKLKHNKVFAQLNIAGKGIREKFKAIFSKARAILFNQKKAFFFLRGERFGKTESVERQVKGQPVFEKHKNILQVAGETRRMRKGELVKSASGPGFIYSTNQFAGTTRPARILFLN